MRGRVALGLALGGTSAAIVLLGMVGAAAIPVVVGLSLLASAGLWIGHRSVVLSGRTVLLIAVGLRLLALPLAPSLSDDGYRYEWDGRVRMELGASPYAFPPSQHPELSRELYRKMNSAEVVSVYPPLSQAVFSAVVWLTGPHHAWAWPLLKGLLVLGELVGLVALSRLVRPALLTLYAWHPLSVLEGAGQGHTEILLVGLLGVLLGAWTHRPRWTAAALVAGAAVKVWPIALSPLVWRRSGWRAFAVAVLLAVVLSAPWLVDADVGGVLASYGLYAGVFDFYSAPYGLLKSAFWPVLGESGGRWAALTLGAVWLLMIAWQWVSSPGSARDARPLIGLVVAYGLLSSVQHPWHWLPILAVVPLLQNRLWLYWLITGSIATYFRYTDAPWVYQLAILVGWGGAGMIALAAARARGMQRVLRQRAVRKWDALGSVALWSQLPSSSRVLDLGTGEGYVGDRLAERTGAAVTLADVIDLAQSPRPLQLIQPGRLPFAAKAFDGVVISYVLHHARAPIELLSEAVRVSSGCVVVLETVQGSTWYNPLLHLLDKVANRMRSHRQMENLPPTILSVHAWREKALAAGLSLEVVRQWGRVHPQALFVVTASTTSCGDASA